MLINSSGACLLKLSLTLKVGLILGQPVTLEKSENLKQTERLAQPKTACSSSVFPVIRDDFQKVGDSSWWGRPSELPTRRKVPPAKLSVVLKVGRVILPGRTTSLSDTRNAIQTDSRPTTRQCEQPSRKGKSVKRETSLLVQGDQFVRTQLAYRLLLHPEQAVQLSPVPRQG